MKSVPRDRLEGRLQGGLGAVPERVVAGPLLGPGREQDLDLETEQLVALEDHPTHADDLGGDLLGGAEDVRVVLGEAAHPRVRPAVAPDSS